MFEADVQRLSQAALDFAERVLQAVVTKVGQPASSERLDELFELGSQALQYAILLESTLRKSTSNHMFGNPMRTNVQH